MTTFSSLASVYAQLANFANLSNFWSLFDTAFGSSYDFATAASLRSQWQAQDFSLLPTVEVISSDVLAGARGSYDGTTNRIYLADSFVTNGTPEAIATVLLKQIGKFVEAKVNNQSSFEDQGVIFAQQVQTLQNQNLSASITTPQQNTSLQSCSCSACRLNSSSSLTSFSIPQEGTSVASGDYRIDALLAGYKWGITNITFSFYSGGSFYGGETGLSVVSEGIKNNVRNILSNVIAPFINVNFVEVADSSSSYGQMRYLLSTNPGYAYAYYPFSTDTNQGNGNDVAGDVFLNPSYDYFDNSAYSNGFQGGPGTHGYQTLIHETLHALGIKHPGNYNGSGVGDPPYLPYGEDNWDNTLMTYNFYSGAEPSTPMAYDVLALQYLYGAKSFNASNTTYNFTNTGLYSDGLRTVGSSTLENKLTIWDSDGIDTLDFSNLGANASGYRFDLNAGGWLSTQTAFNGTGYNVNAGPPVSYTSGTSYYATTSGTRLAYGVTIENLINSSSNDYIIANSAANVFSGYGLFNSTGADIIEGANNLDLLDLSAFTVVNVTQTQSGNNLVLGIGSGRSITVKDYYSVSEGSRIQLGFSGLTEDYQQYYFTYSYGNGDTYSGYVYALTGTYTAGQVLGGYTNETGYDGSYYINYVDSVGYDSSYAGQVYVDNYYDGDTSFASYSADGYGSSGLGSESGTVYGSFTSDSFSNYDEADIPYYDQYYFTYSYGNGDSYSGYVYALAGTYTAGQVLEGYTNETDYNG
ncbi:MAG: M10 family metallopeptidase, partial [Snowella sp.]|nr:M10 family metallopeptidase [Snowella sp.]